MEKAIQQPPRLPDAVAPGSAPGWNDSFSWRLLCRGAVLATAVMFVLSTQFLFQLELYQVWPLAEIVKGWARERG